MTRHLYEHYLYCTLAALAAGYYSAKHLPTGWAITIGIAAFALTSGILTHISEHRKRPMKSIKRP